MCASLTFISLFKLCGQNAIKNEHTDKSRVREIYMKHVVGCRITPLPYSALKSKRSRGYSERGEVQCNMEWNTRGVLWGFSALHFGCSPFFVEGPLSEKLRKKVHHFFVFLSVPPCLGSQCDAKQRWLKRAALNKIVLFRSI